MLSAADEGAAITDNQLLFLEAWRAVDRAYVDKTFNGQTWFRYREQAVKTTRMDSKQDTYGAIRTMLATLVRRLCWWEWHSPLSRRASLLTWFTATLSPS